jgi:hypothetical protein
VSTATVHVNLFIACHLTSHYPIHGVVRQHIIDFQMDILPAGSVSTPLGLVVCALLLLAFSLLWRGKNAERTACGIRDEKRQSMLQTRSPRLSLIVITAAQPFQTPSPKPLENYNLELTDPKLYRPFRHGPSFVTMGIRKMDWNEWIEMDSNFLKYHDTKVSELEKDVNARVQYVDNEVTRLACFEVLEELTQYLTKRYPEVFQLHSGILHNTVTGERFQYPAETPKEAMITAAKLVQDDLVVMVENDDGQYHIDAGAVCLPGFWRLSEKFRMSLDELHIEAGVPHYQEKLQKAMNRFFKSMTCEKPVIRNNVS